MTVYGATPTGFSRKPFDAILASIKSRARALIGAELELDDKDPYGAIVHAASEQIDLVWQALEPAYYGFDPLNAEDFLMFALGSMSGLEQLPPTYGICDSCSVTLEANKTFLPGKMIASVDGNAANRWANRDTVSSTTAGVYTGIVFLSESTGALYAAPAGSLTVIAQRVGGWTAITNVTDAVPGNDAESVDDFRVRREESLAIQGSASPGGVQADVAAVEGVIQVKVYENATELPTTIPPHSLHVIVWDGLVPLANNNEIAQAIHDSKAGGISTVGIATVGSAVGIAIDGNGNNVEIAFDRATVTSLYCEVTVLAPNGTSEAAVKAAIQAKVPQVIGGKLIFLSVNASPLTVDGVTEVPVFKLDVVDPPLNISANITPAAEEILVLDSSNITVTVI